MTWLELPEGPITLPKIGEWPETHHVFAQDDVDAINTALAAGRPLLVRGEPGTGKSQLARAAAHELGRAFVSMTLDARTEPGDLLWSLDAVRRLAEAQVAGAAKLEGDALEARLAERCFAIPGPLWWAFQWDSASKLQEANQATTAGPVQAAGVSAEKGVVVLIDEIDKADSSVPNGLLESLGQGRFVGPDGIEIVATPPLPLVIVTTNEERALPPAFLRRCLVHHLRVPRDVERLKVWLKGRGRAHFGEELSEKVLHDAADMLADDRATCLQRGVSPPGGAEYLDLLRAVRQLAEDDKERLELLGRIGKFALEKHPPEPMG